MALKPLNGWNTQSDEQKLQSWNEAGSPGNESVDEPIPVETLRPPVVDVPAFLNEADAPTFMNEVGTTARNDVVLGAVNPTDVAPILPESTLDDDTIEENLTTFSDEEVTEKKSAKFDYMDCIDNLHMPYDLARAFEEICQDTMFDCTVEKVKTVQKFLEHRIERGNADISLISEYLVFQVIEQLSLSYIGGRVVEGIFEYCTTGDISGLVFANAGLSYIVNTLSVSI